MAPWPPPLQIHFESGQAPNFSVTDPGSSIHIHRALKHLEFTNTSHSTPVFLRGLRFKEKKNTNGTGLNSSCACPDKISLLTCCIVCSSSRSFIQPGIYFPKITTRCKETENKWRKKVQSQWNILSVPTRYNFIVSPINKYNWLIS